ncbi:MAG: di-heme oxidoredictase family protein [Pseudomonadota bacterium]
MAASQVCALLLCLFLGLPLQAAAEALSPALGGETSRVTRGLTALSLPAANLSDQQVGRFFTGLQLFHQPWGPPGSAEVELAGTGLGPLYNATSCGSCHLRDGRGPPPAAGEPLTTVSLQFSQADGHPPARYGRQLQPLSTNGQPEGQVVIQWEEIRGRYPDGRSYRLRRPLPQLFDLSKGRLPPETGLSLRLAPAMSGLGLLEAVPAATLLAAADPQDRDGDGISGQVPQLPDGLGRFGWKSESATIAAQVAMAAQEDLGLVETEAGPTALADLTFYSQTLAVPVAEGLSAPAARRGAQLFHDLGCAACHQPTQVSGAHPIAALSQQRFHPFTDLLLHDLGPGLAERDLTGRLSQAPLAAEWRTAPLWGLGRARQVAGGALGLLHDGRARSPTEAILWHGGEAAAARRAFKALPRAEREALLAFLGAL